MFCLANSDVCSIKIINWGFDIVFLQNFRICTICLSKSLIKSKSNNHELLDLVWYMELHIERRYRLYVLLAINIWHFVSLINLNLCLIFYNSLWTFKISWIAWSSKIISPLEKIFANILEMFPHFLSLYKSQVHNTAAVFTLPPSAPTSCDIFLSKQWNYNVMRQPVWKMFQVKTFAGF